MNRFIISLIALFLSHLVAAQTLTLDLGVGINSPSDDFGLGYKAKGINGLTVDAGIRYMFKKKLGAKVDIGFNRYGADDNSIDFKANLTRVNAQLYYNLWDNLYDLQIRLPERLAIFVHAGPGMTFLKPLSEPYNNEKSSAFNVLGGLAVHYGITDRVAVFVDGSNFFNMGQKQYYEGEPLDEKISTSMFNLTFGVTISINSDCYYCAKPEMGVE